MSNKLRVFEAFSGYGSQSMALRNLDVDYEVVAISEIDKYVIQAYQAVHGNVLNLGDISKINVEDIPDHDLFTYSFPCQDISVAGKTQGIERGKTRSGLLYECEKIIEAKRPKYLLLENVKNLVGKKFKEDFDKWLEYLEGLGYANYWKVLNAKDFGVPQNRERVFVISILGEHKPYEFPNSISLDKTIKDVLEDEVDEKYYLSDDKVRSMKLNLKDEHTLTTVQKDNYVFEKYQKPTNEIVMSKVTQMVEFRKYEVDIDKLKSELKKAKEKSKLSIMDISNTLDVKKTTVEHWFRNDNCFSIPSREIWNDLKTLLNIRTNEFDKSITEFELKENEYDTSNRVYHINGVSPTLTCDTEATVKKILIPQTTDGIFKYRIRKLTTKEYFRLMGLSDADIEKIKCSGVSSSQQYKMAGNSIVVSVLEAIFKNLLI